jgi:ABC-type multidrug transport system fused ATPase/permease subunit
MIARRLWTISGAEAILVLHDAHIVEEGTHRSLMEKRPAFYTLYEEQTKLHEKT